MSHKQTTEKPKRITQESFNDLCRELTLNIEKSEVMGEYFQDHNLFVRHVDITAFRNENRFSKNFTKVEIVLGNGVDSKHNLTYCHDIKGLFELFKHDHKSDEWSLLLDGRSYNTSFRAILLHNGNKLPSVPLAYCPRQPENSQAMERILSFLNYQQHQWNIVTDFKFINILLDIKGENKVLESKISLSSLHIKYELTTMFCKNIYEENAQAWAEIEQLFPGMDEVDLETCIFDGPQIKTILQCEHLMNCLNRLQKKAFKRLIKICQTFVDDKEVYNYQEMICGLMGDYEKINITVTEEIQTLIGHLDRFKVYCGTYLDTEGERFQQDIMTNDVNYSGVDMTIGLGRYCWGLIFESDPKDYGIPVDMTKYFQLYKI